MSIEIVQGMALEEPALFLIPSLSADRAKRKEPTNHMAPVRSIKGVAIGLPRVDTLSHAARRVRKCQFAEQTPAMSSDDASLFREAHLIVGWDGCRM